MPILEVEVVVEAGEQLADDLAGRLADAAARVMGSDSGHTWVRLRSLPETHYAENEGGPPDGVRPVFITILKRHLPEPDVTTEECRALTQTLSVILERPAENVHLLYLPGGAGRVAFGGRLVR